MSAIVGLRGATEGELRAQIDFLRQPLSPVKWAADYLDTGTHVLQIGTIKTIDGLGDQVSIFSNLDGIFASKEVGLPKFRVRHVRDILLDQRCSDVTSRERLESIEQGLRAGALTPNMTFLVGNPTILIDGNKTAAAFHHLHQADEGIDLKVFVISAR